jgi:hypothetical protein
MEDQAARQLAYSGGADEFLGLLGTRCPEEFGKLRGGAL